MSTIGELICRSNKDILCVAEDSLVRMHNGCRKRIDLIRPGDAVASLGGGKCEVESVVVDHVFQRIHEGLVVIWLEGGSSIKCTADHPVWTVDRGWCAVDWMKATDSYRENVLLLGVGYCCLTYANGYAVPRRIVGIERLSGRRMTYVISAGKLHGFFANDIFVHDENIAALTYESIGCYEMHACIDYCGFSQQGI